MKPAAAPAGASASSATTTDPIVMYVVIRSDLRGAKGWPLGSLVAQACHASVAITASAIDEGDDATRAYVHADNVDHMRKVVLETKNEEALRTLSSTLEASGIKHKLWIEQPENVATWYV